MLCHSCISRSWDQRRTNKVAGIRYLCRSLIRHHVVTSLHGEVWLGEVVKFPSQAGRRKDF